MSLWHHLLKNIFTLRLCTVACCALISCALWPQPVSTLAVAQNAPPPAQNGETPHPQPPTAASAAAASDAKGHNTDEPTLTLFTAINEGNVPYVRDAINRGADLEGHNILGQTPLDMAIDLNRNPITFLLLSLRSHKKHTVAAASAPPALQHEGPIEESHVSKKAELLGNLPLAQTEYDTAGTTEKPVQGFLGFDGS